MGRRNMRRAYGAGRAGVLQGRRASAILAVKGACRRADQRRQCRNGRNVITLQRPRHRCGVCADPARSAQRRVCRGGSCSRYASRMNLEEQKAAFRKAALRQSPPAPGLRPAMDAAVVRREGLSRIRHGGRRRAVRAHRLRTGHFPAAVRCARGGGNRRAFRAAIRRNCACILFGAG